MATEITGNEVYNCIKCGKALYYNFLDDLKEIDDCTYQAFCEDCKLVYSATPVKWNTFVDKYE